MRTLNLGILAHVDAGKTSLTERLLYAAGVIDEIGSVDDGSTQTDSLALERQRGITIKAAVVSFTVDDVTVNLIDTPGHPDFIAEVERVLSVLDGAVLVISAVESVQSQTRILMRTLRRLHIPTLIFVNKLDRRGADPERVLQDIGSRLTTAIIAMGAAQDAGARTADFRPYSPADSAFAAQLTELLAEHDDALLAAFVDEHAPAIPYSRLLQELRSQTGRALVHPVYVGSAITGVGVGALMEGVSGLLPTTAGDVTGPPSGTVFKIERGPAGEKIAYVRMFSGTVRARDRPVFRRGRRGRQGTKDNQTCEGKVTAIRVFERGQAVQADAVVAGQIGKLWGLGDVQIGDVLGEPPGPSEQHQFAPPTLEAVIVPRHAGARSALYRALTRMAEQDPLINLRQDDVRQELFVSLYGEVQKEVIQATLADDFGIPADFQDTTTICIERPAGMGAAAEIMARAPNPFLATIGLRIEPAPVGSGLEFRLEVEYGSIPLSFHKAVEDTVRDTLRQGLHGWQVTDCTVTMTHSGYSSVASTAGDFRNLTPLVLMAALQQAGTTVYEPMHSFQLEIPANTVGACVACLARLRAVPQTQELRGTTTVLTGEIPAAQVYELQRQVPGLTRGEGVLESSFGRYRPVTDKIPVRPRTDHNPLNRKEYLLHVVRRV
ncbi:MAG: GTP-binding protein [Chloroflexota bacterium]